MSGHLLLLLLSIDKVKPWNKEHGQGEKHVSLRRSRPAISRRPSQHGEQLCGSYTDESCCRPAITMLSEWREDGEGVRRDAGGKTSGSDV